MKALAIVATEKQVYALRADGAVFVLIRRGDLVGPALEPATDPYWAACPAVPGTEAALEQEG